MENNMRVILMWTVIVQTSLVFSVVAQFKPGGEVTTEENKENGEKKDFTRFINYNDSPYKPIFGSHSYNPLSDTFETQKPNSYLAPKEKKETKPDKIIGLITEKDLNDHSTALPEETPAPDLTKVRIGNAEPGKGGKRSFSDIKENTNKTSANNIVSV